MPDVDVFSLQVFGAGAYKVPCVRVLFFLSCILFLCLHHTLGVGFVRGVERGENVLALAYSIYVIHLGWGWFGRWFGDVWGNNNVLALAYSIYFSYAYVIHLECGLG